MQNSLQTVACTRDAIEDIIHNILYYTICMILYSAIPYIKVRYECCIWMNRYKKPGNSLFESFEAFYNPFLSTATNKGFQTQCVWQTTFLHTTLCSEKDLGKIPYARLSHIAEAMRREEIDERRYLMAQKCNEASDFQCLLTDTEYLPLLKSLGKWEIIHC